MKKMYLMALIAIISVAGVSAQKLKTVNGNPEIIKNDKNINVVFTYENLKVGKMEEAAYIERKVKEREDKEPGTGENWEKLWQDDKEDRYPPKFCRLFNQYAGDLFGANIDEDVADAKVTMKVNVSWIEPGFNVGVARKPAGVSMEIYIYETANPDKVLHECTIINAPGTSMGNDYDVGERIGESFAKAAKEYAKFLHKKHLK